MRNIEGLPNAEMVAGDKGEFAGLYGEIDGGQLLLIRPDGYIASRSHLDEADVFFEYLDKWFNALDHWAAVLYKLARLQFQDRGDCKTCSNEALGVYGLFMRSLR